MNNRLKLVVENKENMNRNRVASIGEVGMSMGIELLEQELLPHTELAYMLDKMQNYELSLIHHKECIRLLEKIQELQYKELRGHLYEYEEVYN